MKNSKQIRLQSGEIVEFKDYSSKSVRQAAFKESSKGMSPKEIVEKAKLFQGIDVSRFKLVNMPA